MVYEEEYFGTPAQVGLMRRSADLWRLLSSDPRFASYGRLVALSTPVADTAELLISLARLQGAGVCYYLPKTECDALFSQVQALGFGTDRHEHFRGGKRAYAASRAVLAKHEMPADLSLCRLDRASDTKVVADVAALCQDCGLMPVPGSVMRGVARRGLTLAALDPTGAPVATASAFGLHHPDALHAGDVFWGMLATRPDRRGQKIALLLGAMALCHMWEVEGARGFITGVRADNASSKRLCNRLGVEETAWVYAQCLDRALLGTGRVTK
ncbi:hypothetical protein [Meridianimarinicoccus sp. MJW13]|uniref:hypothetical protein n=1 Tax=Meridianimarinicoccus sp. MJW13 TaxID=2720031 RepID=UPI001867FFB0|nr:hypothetical protein [Fluviibacterium sp. MJW13]